MVYSQNTRRLGSYQTKSAINPQNSICEMNASYSSYTTLNSLFGGRRDEHLHPSCHKIILRYTNSRREETHGKARGTKNHSYQLLSVSLEPIFNKFCLTFKIFFHPTKQTFRFLQIPRNSTFSGLDLQFSYMLLVLVSATIHSKSKQNPEYNIAWGAQVCLWQLTNKLLLLKGQ